MPFGATVIGEGRIANPSQHDDEKRRTAAITRVMVLPGRLRQPFFAMVDVDLCVVGRRDARSVKSFGGEQKKGFPPKSTVACCMIRLPAFSPQLDEGENSGSQAILYLERYLGFIHL